MGIQRLTLSTISGVALVATLLYVGDDCVSCDQEIATTDAGTTTAPPAGPTSAESELRIEFDSDIDLQGFGAVQAATSSTTEGGDETTSTEPTESTDTTAATSTPTGDETAAGDGTSGEGSTTTTAQATTSSSAAVATPPPVGSNVPVSGSKIYVDPRGGSDANDGTSATTALKSLQNAFRRVQAGQTVYMMSGEYRELKDPGTLHYFIKNPDRVLSREELLAEVWDYPGSVLTRTVDVHVGQLRRKLDQDQKNPIHFVTVRGLGYRFVPNAL